MDENYQGRITDPRREGYSDLARSGAVAGLGFVGEQMTKTRAPAVPEALERLDKAVAALYNEVDAITNRLQPILGHVLPQAVGTAQQKDQENVPSVAGRIRTCEQSLHQIRGRISDLLQRLEV